MSETVSSTESLSDDTGPQPPPQHNRPWSSNMAGPAALSRGIQRTISETMNNDLNGEDSPVLNETLSVINEHITDFNTPRQSVAAQEHQNDSGSEYSSHIGHRISYIPGTETDEEDENDLTEEEVRSWSPEQTAEHLRELGVDPKHCEIFEQEEITGDVLLEMDQEFVFMKEFNFGVMGRRLKTWHKIKALQEEIRGVQTTRQSVSQSISSQPNRQSSGDYRSQSRAGTTSFLPRIPSVNESHRRNRSRSDTSTTFEATPPTSSPSSFSQMRKMSSSRPSADSIRRSNHHRRHSSIETDSRPPNLGPRSSTTPGKPAFSQRGTMSSFDRGWTMTGGQPSQSRPGTALGTSDDAAHHSVWSADDAEGSFAADADPVDLDRGYFSGGELDSRRSKNLLRKRGTTGRSMSHSRKSSATDDQGVQHLRFGSDSSVLTSMVSPTPQPFREVLPTNRIRTRGIASTDMAVDKSHSPTVTNLERSSSSTVNFFSSLSPLNPKSGDAGISPSSVLKHVGPKSKFRRAMGLRAISDAVAGNEKSVSSSSTSISPAKDARKSTARTDSGSPSGGSKSFEIDSTDSSLKGADGALGFLNRPKALSNRTKSKKDTSAYMRGLEKRSPQEQIVGCDYYGWMKKKSSNLMATWKPRLFVLRGRRLSYYYSEDDTEERGLIDISSHRVFRADQDTITSLHATLTGARATPTSSHIGTPETASPIDAATPGSPLSKSNSSDAPFIFKLVPPKAGSARGVQFTKPAIHYFQVDNIQQGRLWMAALMKATIDRDLNLPVRTTNKQKTISLRQAKTMGHRPPALMEEGEQPEEADDRGGNLRDSKTDESPASSDFSSILALRKLEGIEIDPSSLSSEITAAERPSSN